MLTMKTAKALGMRHIINFLRDFRQDINKELAKLASPCGLLLTMFGVSFTIVGRGKSYFVIVEGINPDSLGGGNLEFKLGRNPYLISKPLLNDLEVYFHKNLLEEYAKAKIVLENDIKTVPKEPIAKKFRFIARLIARERIIDVSMFDGIFNRKFSIMLTGTMGLTGKLNSSLVCYCTAPISQLVPKMHSRIYTVISTYNDPTKDHDAWIREQITKFVTKMFY